MVCLLAGFYLSFAVFYWIASVLAVLLNSCSNGVVSSVYFGDLNMFLQSLFVLFLMLCFGFL